MSCNAQQSEALGFVHGNYYVVGEEMEVNRCLTISRSYSADDQPDSDVDFRMPGDLRASFLQLRGVIISMNIPLEQIAPLQLLTLFSLSGSLLSP